MNAFFGEKEKNAGLEKTQQITLKTIEDEVVLGNLVKFSLKNNSVDKIFNFISSCDENIENNDLEIGRILNGKFLPVKTLDNCQQKILPNLSLKAGDRFEFDLSVLADSVFDEAGKYQLKIKFSQENNEKVDIFSETFLYEEPGIIRQLFRAIITKPLFNILIFIIDSLNNHSLGIAIILITVLVRLLLFAPNQKALKSQKALQKLQPKIEEVREKYAKNQQQMALKIMEVYKTHNISPMSSFVPMLLQFPVLIGVYFVIRDGINPHMSIYLYKIQEAFDFSIINNLFLGMDLSAVSDYYYLSIIVAGVQWFYLRLSFQKSAKNVVKTKSTGPDMQKMQKIMQWVLPLMIGGATAFFPAGIGLYWLVSTLFGVGQLYVINMKEDIPTTKRIN
jgi:YidC/Oxa1 family membrane protein insertase